MKFLYAFAERLRNFVLSYPKHIKLSDEYIERLLLVNPGMLHPGNLYCFNYAIRHLKSTKPIIEVGAFCGLSTNIMNYYLQKANKKNVIFSCDPWKYKFVRIKLLNKFSASESEFDNFVKESFTRSTNLFSKPRHLHAFQILSNDFFRLWYKNDILKDIKGKSIKLGGEISFCYIDGDHSYKQTKNDFENVDKFLEKGGFVFFDDTASYAGFECANLMSEILKNKKYKLIINNPNYLFQKIAC